ADFNLPNIISVGASDSTDHLAYFSNYGQSSVDLTAPGVSIYSTWPGRAYKSESGTSMASPHVAGAAALVLAAHPAATADTIKALLMRTVDHPRRLPAPPPARAASTSETRSPAPTSRSS